MALSEFISSSAYCHMFCNVVRVSFAIPLSSALTHNCFSDGSSARVDGVDVDTLVLVDPGYDLLLFIKALSN